MASSEEYVDFVLGRCGGICARAMMGEYMLYYGGKVVGGVYDNCLLVNHTPSAKALMPGVAYENPYDGAKAVLLIENIEDRAFFRKAF